MPTLQEQARPKVELPKCVINQAQFVVRVTSTERREKLLKVMEATGERRLSTLFWVLADFYLERAGRGRETATETETDPG